MPYSGKFSPKNPIKYRGNTQNIVYRSLWELRFMKYIDENPYVVEWASEEFCIPYINPVDDKIHRYFPDFWLKTKDTGGHFNIKVVEIKPKKQMEKPNKRTHVTRAYLREVATYAINQAKWIAAERYCEDRNWQFVKMNEHDLGIA